MKNFIYLIILLPLAIQSQIVNFGEDSLKNNLFKSQVIPNEILSVELQIFFNSSITINYEKNIFKTNDIFTLNYEFGMGVTQWNGDLDAITQQVNLRAMFGKRHCFELGTGLYLNYFVKNKVSHNPNLTSDLVKLRLDMSYRFQTTYIDNNALKDTDMFKVTLGVYYMFNKTPNDTYLNNGLIILSPSVFPNSHFLFINLGLSLNLWTI